VKLSKALISKASEQFYPSQSQTANCLEISELKGWKKGPKFANNKGFVKISRLDFLKKESKLLKLGDFNRKLDKNIAMTAFFCYI
jgi:hypothetical protein